MLAPTPRSTASRAIFAVGLFTFTLAFVGSPDDAHAQRRRRRRGRSHPTTQTEPQNETPESSAPDADTAPTAPSPTPVAAPLTNPEPVTQAPQTTPSAPVEAPRTHAPPVIDVAVGFRAQGRSFWFVDDLFQRLRPYSLPFAPGIAGSLEFYPGALVSSGPASWFGIVGSGEYLPALTSRDALNNTYATTAYAVSGGIRVRYRTGPLDAGATVAYLRQAFTIDSATRPEGIPNVTYQSMRLGLDARVDVTDRFALFARGAYLLVFDLGEIGTDAYFPHATAGGAEAGLGGAFRIVSGLEVRLQLDWRRYFMGMHPEPEDRYIAGGAADDYYSATLGLAFRR
jgi:hypothetical protein